MKLLTFQIAAIEVNKLKKRTNIQHRTSPKFPSCLRLRCTPALSLSVPRSTTDGDVAVRGKGIRKNDDPSGASQQHPSPQHILFTVKEP